VLVSHVRAVLAVAVTVLLGSAAYAQSVKVDGGLIEGKLEDGLSVYRGIPFAAPPVGELRWKAPQPAVKWQGVLKAEAFGPACLQNNAAIANLAKPSEDCLYLNVWTPATRAGERLPVMVWIHGGGFTAGSPPERLYHGEAIAKKGVVVVTVAYRLGVFGFMAHPGLSAESSRHVSGNYGLLDMIAGLQWVKKNVAAFGGDPGRVTIFGESAGGIAVSMLCASPLAKGLFQAAISQSGGSFGPVRENGGPGENVQPLASAERAGAEWGKTQNATSLADLRKMPGQQLLDASRGQRGLNWPIMDGYVIPDDQYTLYSAARYNDVPVLIGYNSDEGASFGNVTARDAYVTGVQQRYGQLGDRLLAAYPWGDGAARKTARDLSRDTTFGWHTWTWARLQTKTGKSKAYLYYFDQHPQYPPDSPQFGVGSPHGAEMPYVFSHFNQRSGQPTADDLRLSETMITYWTNFAKNHDPNGAGLPAWPSYSEARPQMMYLLTAPHAGPIVSENGLKVLDEYFAWRRQSGTGAATSASAAR
jgi:para-nitrobenzyl esterase